MFEKDVILKQLEGKKDEEQLQILQNELGMSFDSLEGSYKIWFAEVFTFCYESDLQDELNRFLFLINLVTRILGLCFQVESTVCLDCACACGSKQVILYYSITPRDLEVPIQPA